MALRFGAAPFTGGDTEAQSLPRLDLSDILVGQGRLLPLSGCCRGADKDPLPPKSHFNTLR